MVGRVQAEKVPKVARFDLISFATFRQIHNLCQAIKFGDSWRGNCGGGGSAERLAEDGFDFHGTAVLAIELHAAFVWAHGAGFGHSFVDDVGRKLDAVAAGGGDDFIHNGADEIFALRCGEETLGVEIERAAEAVEGDVPDELGPAAGFETGENVAGDF